MKASVISLLLVLCGLTTGLIRDHIFINIPKNWTDAQSYCREHYTDLSTIQSEEELKILLGLQGANVLRSWIGLHRDNINSKNFLWFDGAAFSYSNWDSNEPNNYNGRQACVSMTDKWCDSECWNIYPFYCHKNFFLFKESMAWEEALEYCRAHHTNLASFTTDSQVQIVKNGTLDAQTDSLWTGLRFLAGDWFWADGKHLGDQITLPECPIQPNHCGARNTKTDTWENRDCEEKLNFLCI